VARPAQVIVTTPARAAASVADEITALLARAAQEHRPATLAIATGRTPLLLYDELARRARDGAFEAADVVIFPLDEFVGIDAADPRSLWSCLRDRLVRPLGLDPRCLRLFDREPAAYERAIAAAGGLDYVVLGIGRNGHIAYNEPGAARTSRTRVVALAQTSREDAAESFGGIENVPTHGVTIGIATILDAKRVRLLAFGAAKRDVVKRMWQEPIGTALPASFLRDHRDFVMYVDQAAAP
jgi:glucosamine-6-phosphate deaminase